MPSDVSPLEAQPVALPEECVYMNDKDSYYRRLWNLLNLGRSASVRHLAESLLTQLEADFVGEKKHFAESEYRDPVFRDALLEILLRQGTVLYFPRELAALIKKMIGDGEILSLYSGMGEFLVAFGGGVGVEPNPLVARWSKFLLAIAGIGAEVVQEEPPYWGSTRKFDRIVCNTPYGVKRDHTVLLASTLARLSSAGQVALLVPPAFLQVEKYKWYREWVPSVCHVKAIISLPPKIFARTNTESAIVVIESGKTGKTYMAGSRSLADMSAIGEDYTAWREGQNVSLGFESTLDQATWHISHYKPIDFGIGAVPFPYQVVLLRDVGILRQGVFSPESRLAVNRTGSKVSWLDGEMELIEKNNIFLEPKTTVNPMYLYLYLSSSLGKQALSRFIKGAAIPHVSATDLQNLPVVLPDLSRQAQIVAQALEIKKTASTLGALVAEANQSLVDNFFELETARNRFRAFSAETDKVFYQTLPFPIAIMYRKVANAPNNTQRFSFLIELFEAVIRFIVLVQVADHLSSSQQEDVLAKIPELSKLSRPSLGTWVSLFRSLSQFQTEDAFLKEAKMLRVTDYQKTMDEFVRLRNESFKGHGATLTEAEYEMKFQEHVPAIYELISKLSFLANYRLVKTGLMEKDGDYYRISVQALMGDNPVFETQTISSRIPFDTHRVLYLNASLDSLVLDPFVILEPCAECQRPELLLLDKFSDRKITYLGNESGHKPTYPTVDKLPVALREAAFGQL
jgi:hypothetical protein